MIIIITVNISEAFSAVQEHYWSFPSGSDRKESACNAGDRGLIPRLGKIPGEEKGYPLKYPCVENCKDRGDWQTTVHGVTKTEQLTLSLQECY